MRLSPASVLAFAAIGVACHHSPQAFAQPPIQLPPASAPPGSDRLRIFIGDTHFGPGKVNGQWHPYEDFRWPEEYALFLAEMKRQGNGNADLILNGDTFELWQTLEKDCLVKGHPDFGCTEVDALQRVRRVFKDHDVDLKSIGDFARDRQNQVVIVPGNHDAALLFPGVAKAVLDHINAPGHTTVAFEGYWISPDALVYAEHGHQIAKEVNTYDYWPNPFIPFGGKQYIQRPWGQQFVQKYYSDFEMRYPIVDNVGGELTGLKLAIKAEGRSNTLRDVGQFFSFYLNGLSFKQAITPGLGAPGESPSWDYAAIAATGDHFLVESVPADDDFHAIAQQEFDQGHLAHAAAKLKREDIDAICTFRLNKIADDRDRGRPPSVQPCPGNLGALQSLFNSRDKIFRDHFQKTIESLIQQRAVQRRFQVFIWSHTHEADQGFNPRQHESDGWNPIVVNTGAWQRTITAQQLAKLQADRKLNDKQTLQLIPEDLPPCYPFVQVKPYQVGPVSNLQFWRKTAAGWSQGDDCGPAH